MSDKIAVIEALLGKVDKARVLQASENMQPAAATKLLAGVLGWWASRRARRSVWYPRHAPH